jgi:hypothetical protein
MNSCIIGRLECGSKTSAYDQGFIIIATVIIVLVLLYCIIQGNPLAV